MLLILQGATLRGKKILLQQNKMAAEGGFFLYGSSATKLSRETEAKCHGRHRYYLEISVVEEKDKLAGGAI